MSSVHRLAGFGVVGILWLMAIWGLVLRIARRREAPSSFWFAQHWTENILIFQAVLGIVLFLIGRRVVGGDLVFLHYFYGSLFPAIAMISGRIAGLRRKERDAAEYVGAAWGAFFAAGLTTRALMTGLGVGL